MTTADYFGTEETNRRRELTHGILLRPDVLFVSTERLSIIRDQVRGAFDLAGARRGGHVFHDRASLA